MSLEYFQLRHRPEEITLSGTVLGSDGGKPLRAEYTVRCTPSWVTRSVHVTLALDAATSELSLITDQQGRWWRDGEELTEVAGCVDVDISLSPSTNTLPIRRLTFTRGDARDVTAAWIRFPGLTVEPLPQRYVQTEDRVYRYSSAGGAFTADIEVDEVGLVVSFPPLWERVA